MNQGGFNLRAYLEVTQAASEPQIEAEHESVSLLLLLFTVEFTCTRPIGRNGDARLRES